MKPILEEYYKTLKDLDKNLQEVKKKYHISGITAGMDAQVEVKPNHEPFVGGGTTMSGNTTKYCELDSKFESFALGEVHEARDQAGEYFLQRLGTHKSEDDQAGLLESG